ncbi:dynein regulatory complex protein 8-like [Synchiropus splendidus]|uniref:dynein regulatory complex protein 8-like n=1 Tax=Synchiropus splendidus TaxID=270530 RepID=UPI00237E3C63|nr:dynein regulatory complex protein 8-like [Synchiropus splendidus]
MADKPSAEVRRIHKKIQSAFKVFDIMSNDTVDVREIDTIIYSLGCFPSQSDVHKFITEIDEDHTGYISYDKFLPAMTKVLQENKFPPITDEDLLQAFQVLDNGKKGYLAPEELSKHIMQEGEPFTQDEMDEMLMAFCDPDKNVIFYEDIITQLAGI